MAIDVSEPLAVVEDAFNTELFGYSVLQLTVGAFVVAGAIAGVRWAFGKALGNKKSS